MKKLAYLLSILILFQSCYSYKTFDLNNYETIKPKKVKIELKNAKKYDGKIIEYSINRIVLKNTIKTRIISVSEIEKIKGRKFSLAKTLGFTYGILVSILVGSLAYFFNGL
tara:strand:- start:30 stop:362 length:333 start_codon:yes stop_codon:yes gene_type:complete